MSARFLCSSRHYGHAYKQQILGVVAYYLGGRVSARFLCSSRHCGHAYKQQILGVVAYYLGGRVSVRCQSGFCVAVDITVMPINSQSWGL